MKNIILLISLLLIQACGQAESSESQTSNFLEGGGWAIDESPYNLPPGSTIAVCDQDATVATQFVLKAVRLWLDAGGRDERITVKEGCRGDRVILLSKLIEKVDFYGRAHPLTGNIYNIDVPTQWAGHWTANHEIGHVFGFAHIFNNVISIMNSDNNGAFMNGGYLSSYDRTEIKRMLSLSHFKKVNALWEKKPAVQPLSASSSTPLSTAPTLSRSTKSCLGADGSTYYSHGTVTRYKNERFTCDNGKWLTPDRIH
jgi:hypothetical protein